MQSSNQPASPYTEVTLPTKRKWKLGATLFSLMSIAGGLAVNNYLNPPSDTVTIGGSTASAEKTVTSDQIPYEFGYVELTVTSKDGKLSAIDVGTSTATDGREQAYPYLVEYAIAAQGTNFSNLSGATYTTDAFKVALENAISKLG
ncbi:MAG: hypothetical protein RL529_1085 [Actinomycetota bacterium]